MEEKKLKLDAPFLSMGRIPTKPENSSEPENTKKKKTTTRRRKVKDSCQETEHENLVRLLHDDQSFEHVREQTLGEPKEHHTLIEESDLIKALEMVSSAASFSANSTNGVGDEFEKNGDRSSNVSRDDVTLEYRDLIMSRFLPAAKAMAMKQTKQSSQEEKKKKQSIALQRVSMAINQDLKNDDDDDYDHNHVDGTEETVHSNDSKKALLGFLPRFCSKNSLDVLNPVLSRVKTCQNLGVSKITDPKSQDSVYKAASLPRILRSNKVSSKSRELCPIQRFSSEVSKISLSKSVRISRNHLRLQRTAMADQIQTQGTRFLAEEVKRMRNRNKIRSENLSVSQPPLPKTPSESWLCRTLPRSSVAAADTVVFSGQATGLRKVEQKTNSQSMKWETIVKTSYKHHDHVRNSEETTVVHPSRQHKP